MADGRDYFKASIDYAQFDRDAAHIKGQFADIGKKAEFEGARFEGVIKNVGVAIAGVFTMQKATQFAKDIASVRGEFQQLDIAFETMLGNKAKSDALMTQLIDTAAKTPFDLTGVANGAKQLLAYGTSAEKVNDTLIMLGDVAAGLSIPLNDLVYLYGTTQVQGRMFSKDIYQFMGRGIPIIKELSKELGVAEDSVMELVTAGKVGFPELQKIFEKLTAEGGMFSNLMEKQSASITGQIANLEDAIDVMKNELGKSSEGAFTSAIDAATLLVENYEKVGMVIGGVAVTYGTYKAAVIAVNLVMKEQAAINAMVAASNNVFNKSLAYQWVWTERVQKAKAALNKTMLTNPYVLATMAVVGLGYATYKLITHQTEAEKAQKRLNNAIKEAESSSISEERNLARLKGQLDATTQGTDEYNKIKETIVKNYGKYYDGLEKEIEQVGLATSVYEKLTAAIRKSFGARKYEAFMQSEQENLDKIMSENLGKIQDRLIDNLGDNDYAARVYEKIRSAIVSGSLEIDEGLYKFKGLDSETQAALDKVSGRGDFISRYAIEGYIKSTLDAIRLTDKLNEKSKQKFGINDESKSNNEEPAVFKFIGKPEQIEEAKKKVAKLKQELDNLNKGLKPEGLDEDAQFDFAKGIEDKTKELNAALDKLSYLQTGKPASSSGVSGNSASKLLEEQQKIADYELKLQNERIKNQFEARQFELDNQQEILNLKEDGFEKEQEQLELNHQKALLAIDRRTHELVERQQQAERNALDVKPEKEKNSVFNPTTTSLFDLSHADQSEIAERLNTAYKTEEHSNQTHLQSLLDKYQDFNARKLAIDKEYQADLNALEKKAVSPERDAAINELKKRWKEALSSLDLEEFQDSIDWSAVFGNLDKVTTEELSNLRDKLREYLSSIGDSLSPTDFKTITDTLDDIDNKLSNRQPITELKDGYEEYKKAVEDVTKAKKELAKYEEKTPEYIEAQKKVNAEENKRFATLSKMTKAVNEMGRMGGDIVNAGNEIVDMLSSLGVEVGESVSRTLDGVGQIMSGLEKIDLTKPFSVVTGSITALTGLGKTIGGLFGLGSKDDKLFKQIEGYEKLVSLYDQLIDKQKEYLRNLTGGDLLKQISETEELIRRKEESERKKLQSWLKTGASANHHSMGYRINRDLKKELESMGIKDISEALSFDAEKWKEIQKNIDVWEKLPEEVRNYAQAVIDAKGDTESLAETIKEINTQTTFEGLRDGFKSTLLDMKSDAKSIASDLEKIMQEAMINSILDEEFNDWLKDWRNKLNDSMTSGGKIDKDEYKELQEEWQRQLEKKLSERDAMMDMFGWGKEHSQQSSRAMSVSMNQETGDYLSGRVTNIDSTLMRFEPMLSQININTAESSRSLKESSLGINEMVNLAITGNQHLYMIEKYTSELQETNELLSKVVKNTSGFNRK